MDKYIELAKNTIEEFIKNDKTIEIPKDMPAEFYSRKAGVFVTIYNGDDLRGCIGTYLPTKENIAKEIINNAIAASSSDFRFLTISKNELPKLRYEVSILSQPLPLSDIKKHNPKIHGLIAKCSDGRCGLLLPGIESVDSTQKQIYISCQKGGIDPEKEDIRLFEFTVEKHS